MGEVPEVVRPADTDALALVDAEHLSEDEALYAARAANTVKGYRSDWREWTHDCWAPYFCYPMTHAICNARRPGTRRRV